MLWKPKKKRKSGVPHSMDDAFLVSGKNRNNQIYWPKLRQFQTKSTRNKREKKNGLKLGEKSIWKYCSVLWELSSSMLGFHLHWGLRGETMFLSHTIVEGSTKLGEWALGHVLGITHDTTNHNSYRRRHRYLHFTRLKWAHQAVLSFWGSIPPFLQCLMWWDTVPVESSGCFCYW